MINERFHLWSILFNNYNLVVWMTEYNQMNPSQDEIIDDETIYSIMRLESTCAAMKRTMHPHKPPISPKEFTLIQKIENMHRTWCYG